MRSRFAGSIGVSVMLAAACGGGAFSGGDDESAGASSGGSANAEAGSTSSKAGGTSGGNGSVGGTVGVSGGEQGQAGESVASSCKTADDCRASSQCHEPTCLAGNCGEKALPDGPFKLQAPGDCKQASCQGGQETLVADADDADDKNECTVDSCTAGGAVHTPRVGESCSNGGGTCSAQGTCEVCNRELCPPASQCMQQVCIDNQCQLVPREPGTLCANSADQCDATGNCVDCWDNGGCDEASICTPQHECIFAI